MGPRGDEHSEKRRKFIATRRSSIFTSEDEGCLKPDALLLILLLVASESVIMLVFLMDGKMCFTVIYLYTALGRNYGYDVDSIRVLCLE